MNNICFLEGKRGPKGIRWETSDLDAYQLWVGAFPYDYSGSSYYRILDAIDRLDIQKLEGTDYYFIYQKEGELKKDPNDIEGTLKRIIYQNSQGVHIIGETTLGLSMRPATNDYFQGINAIAENDIFWDVNNDIVIVRGKDPLQHICNTLVLQQQLCNHKQISDANQLASNVINAPLMIRYEEVVQPEIQKKKTQDGTYQ